MSLNKIKLAPINFNITNINQTENRKQILKLIAPSSIGQITVNNVRNLLHLSKKFIVAALDVQDTMFT